MKRGKKSHSWQPLIRARQTSPEKRFSGRSVHEFGPFDPGRPTAAPAESWESVRYDDPKESAGICVA